MSNDDRKEASTSTPPGAVTDHEGRVLADASDKRTKPAGDPEDDSPERMKARADAAESKRREQAIHAPHTDQSNTHKRDG